MTEPSIYYPEHLKGKQLDAFLERGWYRMFQSVFTTHFISEHDNIHRVFWLRYNLAQIQTGKSQHRLLNNNSRFASATKKAEVTDELETLYALYKTAINFDPSQSVHHWLYGEHTDNIFDTEMIEIRDNGLLIAAGIFDKGESSIAGIMNFYHPAYKKYSLGKYLMLLKIEYAKAKRKEWYYPGYIIYGYPKFDYKLFAGKDAAEIYVPELNSWLKYDPSIMDVIERASQMA